MRGAHRTLDAHRAPRCRCLYCDIESSNENQSVITAELKRVRARVLARIDGDEVQETENSGDAIIDAEAGADAEVVAETATAVPTADQGGPAGDGN
jgi:hypothetical protein